MDDGFYSYYIGAVIWALLWVSLSWFAFRFEMLHLCVAFITFGILTTSFGLAYIRAVENDFWEQ